MGVETSSPVRLTLCRIRMQLACQLMAEEDDAAPNESYCMRSCICIAAQGLRMRTLGRLSRLCDITKLKGCSAVVISRHRLELHSRAECLLRMWQHLNDSEALPLQLSADGAHSAL